MKLPDAVTRGGGWEHRTSNFEWGDRAGWASYQQEPYSSHV